MNHYNEITKVNQDNFHIYQRYIPKPDYFD